MRQRDRPFPDHHRKRYDGAGNFGDRHHLDPWLQSERCGSVTPTPSDSAVTSTGCSRSQTRTWTLTDSCGNTATSVSRTVTWTVDTTGPVFTGCPAGPIDLGCNPTPPTCATVAALGIT